MSKPATDFRKAFMAYEKARKADMAAYARLTVAEADHGIDSEEFRAAKDAWSEKSDERWQQDRELRAKTQDILLQLGIDPAQMKEALT